MAKYRLQWELKKKSLKTYTYIHRSQLLADTRSCSHLTLTFLVTVPHTAAALAKASATRGCPSPIVMPVAAIASTGFKSK
jgi:hypothetical protein